MDNGQHRNSCFVNAIIDCVRESANKCSANILVNGRRHFWHSANAVNGLFDTQKKVGA